MQRANLGILNGMPRRLIQLFAGLVLYGISDSMLLLAGLGVDPWDVLHQGLSRHTGIPVGTWAIIVGALVLLLWIPLRQRPGLGTLCNVILIGAVIDAMLALVTPPHSLAGAGGGDGVGRGPERRGDRSVHRRGPRARAARRADDRLRGPRPLAARGAHRDRGHGAAGRLAARRHGRRGHRGLRGLYRTAGPHLRAPVQPDRSRVVADPDSADPDSADPDSADPDGPDPDSAAAGDSRPRVG